MNAAEKLLVLLGSAIFMVFLYAVLSDFVRKWENTGKISAKLGNAVSELSALLMVILFLWFFWDY